MKYIIPENKVDKIVFRYLDMNLRNLEKRKAAYYDGITFAYPDKEHGILGYENDGTLYIYDVLIDEISNGFGLKESDTKSVITRWVVDKLQLDVKDTIIGLLIY